VRLFHISDVLSITTGRLVSSRHMEGIYDILNFLTGDELLTHQLPRAAKECEPWLKTQFPQLFPDNPLMIGLLNGLDQNIEGILNSDRGPCIVRWVEAVRQAVGLPEHLPVYELGADKRVIVKAEGGGQ
jgi:hypothetical protein